MSFQTDLKTQRYPGIARATLEMSYCNGGINRYRKEKDALRALDAVLSDGFDIAFDLADIDRWLAALPDDDLQIVVDGEESEQWRLVAGAPSGTSALLNQIFEHAA